MGEATMQKGGNGSILCAKVISVTCSDLTNPQLRFSATALALLFDCN